MKKDSKFLVFLVLLAALCAILATAAAVLPTVGTETVLTSGTAVSSESDTVTISREEYEQLMKYQELEEILQIVENYYYQDVDVETMLQGAAAGLLAGIDDPYTFYYTPESYAEMWEDDEGEYAGVGIQIQADYSTGLCTIIRVFLDSPAQEAGLRRGDILVHVEDIDVTAANLQDAVDIMRGKVGTPVAIQVMRGDQLLDFSVNRAQITVNYVNSCMLDDQIGYISFYEFSGSCSEQFEKQYRDLESQGMKALIIDLRDNPGGWVNDAQKVADMFLGKGILATLEYRDGTKEYYRTYDDETDSTIPLVVIVNGSSASASEILAGALQDRERATIVGEQSYGKGIVQWVLDVGSSGAGMQLTIAQYFTPNNNVVHKVGISPDILVEMPEEEVSEMFELGDLSDTQLRTAYEYILTLVP